MRNKGVIFLLLDVFLFLMADLSFAESTERLIESYLDQGLTNNDVCSFILIERSKTSTDKKTLLEQASKCSPDLPAPYFKIASDRLDFSFRGLFETIDFVRKGIRAYKRNLLWSLNLWGLLIRSFFISFILSILIMLLIRFPSEAGLIMHEIHEERKKVCLIFMPLIFSSFGLLPFIASLVSLYGLYLMKRQRAVVYIAFFIIVLLSLTPRIFSIFSIPSYLKAAIDINEGRNNKYGLFKTSGRNDMVSSFAHALALKREGYYQESIEEYKRLTEKYKIPEIYINLGNALYASGNPNGAIEYYKRSLSMRPSGAAYYNLSQVYREMLDFKKGEEYFEEAVRLDPDSLRRYTSLLTRNPNRFVVDVKLPDSFILKQMISERGGLIRATIVTAITMAVILLFFVLDKALKNRAKRCRRCGFIYCNRCSRTITWKDMCLNCYNSLIRMERMYSKERLANLLLLYQVRARRRMLSRLLSTIIPGAGHIYSGRVLEGFLLCWVFLFALTVIILSSIMTEGIYPFHHDWLLPLSVFIIILIYGLSIFHIRRGIQRGWL